jgi:hypothetical protein
MDALFQEQVEHLNESHFLVLYWVATAEDRQKSYNITNCFDDLKAHGITRTKQTAVATVEALDALRFLNINGKGNRKHLYITGHGARAVEYLVLQNKFTPRKSIYLEVP